LCKILVKKYPLFMLFPVSSKQTTPTTAPQPSHSPASVTAYCASTLQTLSTPVISLFQWLFSFFCCCFKKKESAEQSSLAPEVPISSFSQRDPFFLLVFQKDRSFRHPDAVKIATELLNILGEGGPWDWLRQANTLFELEEEHRKLRLHPFENLYLLLSNKGQTKRVVYFKSHTKGSIALSAVLRLVRRKNPWTEFLEKQAARFNHITSNEHFSLIPGFCKALKLNAEEITALVKEKRWEALVEKVVETRKQHFNL
jgi:hypothetical protein